MSHHTRSKLPDSAAESRDPRERILLAAGREFAERGYEAATIRDICTAAGANVAAVNYYFGDKHRLYIESVKHAHEARLRQVPQPEWAPGTPAAQKLRDFVGSMLDRMLGQSFSIEDYWGTSRVFFEVVTLGSLAAIILMAVIFWAVGRRNIARGVVDDKDLLEMVDTGAGAAAPATATTPAAPKAGD